MINRSVCVYTHYLLVQPIDAGVQWTVNLVRFFYQMKHNRAVAAITKRIDAVRG